MNNFSENLRKAFFEQFSKDRTKDKRSMAKFLYGDNKNNEMTKLEYLFKDVKYIDVTLVNKICEFLNTDANTLFGWKIYQKPSLKSKIFGYLERKK